MKNLILIFVFTVIAFTVNAQTNMAAKICLIDFNLLNEVNQQIFRSKLTNDGFLTFEPGLNVSAEFYQTDNISLKISETAFSDQTFSFGSNTQLMIRFKIYAQRKNSFSLGIGPVLFARNTWENISNYQYDDSYKSFNSLQYRIFVLSGELEYNRLINKKLDLSISINHLHPYSLTAFVGLKYWFTRKSSHCNTCPSYH